MAREPLTAYRAAWRGRRVFLTGHSGFIGSWLTRTLVDLGAEVTGYALAPHTDPALFPALQLDRRCTSIFADIRDQAALSQAIAACKPDIVLHLAAQPLVRLAWREPVDTFDVNVMGTVQLLDAVRRYGGDTGVRPAVIVFTTDKVYRNDERGYPFREDDALGGKEPYSASKAASELVVEAYRHAYLADHPMAVVRAGNIVGGGDWSADRLLPDAARALSAGKPLVLRNPDAVRPWQHVLESVDGLLMLGHGLWQAPEKAAGAWNFGPSDREVLTVGQVAARFVAAWGGDARVECHPDPTIAEATLLMLSASRAAWHLGWHTRLTMAETIDWTADWYRRFYAGDDPDTITLDQIRHYFRLGSPE